MVVHTRERKGYKTGRRETEREMRKGERAIQ